MKKILLIASVMASLSAMSSHAQGVFLFTASPRTVWDLAGANPKLGGPYNATFFIGNGTPMINTMTGLTSTPTNSASAFSLNDAWTALTTDANFHAAVNANGSTVAVTPVLANGSLNYNSSSSFAVEGTSASGGTLTVFLVAWDNAYATFQAAAAAKAVVGWSAPFSYTYANTIGTPSGFGLRPLGVVVPEPSSLALAGLGAAAMLVFRRRK